MMIFFHVANTKLFQHNVYISFKCIRRAYSNVDK